MCGIDDRGDACLVSETRLRARGGGEPRCSALRRGRAGCLSGRSGCRNFVANHASADQRIDISGAV